MVTQQGFELDVHFKRQVQLRVHFHSERQVQLRWLILVCAQENTLLLLEI